MKRDFAALCGRQFDLRVCGGGIYGAWTAYDAALRGLQVAIVEQGDWACATSSASSKLIHGGLRYLESFDFRLVRKSLRERDMLLRAAPHCVWPLRFGVPVYEDIRIGTLRLAAGLSIYYFLAQDPDMVLRRLKREEFPRPRQRRNRLDQAPGPFNIQYIIPAPAMTPIKNIRNPANGRASALELSVAG